MKEKIKNLWKEIFDRESAKFYIMLAFVSIILFVYCYFGTQDFFAKTFSEVENLAYFKVIYHNVMAFVLFFGVGSLVFFGFLKYKPKMLGLGLGEKKLGGIILLIGIFVCALCGLSTVLDKEMVATYPLIGKFSNYEWQYILIYFVSYALYYVGWEFLFRGIMQNISMEKTSKLGAILITTMISALIHTSIGGFGKPMIETASALAAGLIFGYVAFKTKSIWYSFGLHMFVGFATDLFICLLG